MPPLGLSRAIQRSMTWVTCAGAVAAASTRSTGSPSLASGRPYPCHRPVGQAGVERAVGVVQDESVARLDPELVQEIPISVVFRLHVS